MAASPSGFSSAAPSAAPIFIDRDGTLIEEVGYARRPEQIRLLPGAAESVARANAAGHPVIVITNQSGVARGFITDAFVQECAAHLRTLLARADAHLDGHYHCPYHPQGRPPYDREHPDRKPGAGMVVRAAQELNLPLEHLRGAWMIGDKRSDLETGAALGLVPLLVRTGYGGETEQALPPDFAARGGHIFDNLAAAIDWILARR